MNGRAVAVWVLVMASAQLAAADELYEDHGSGGGPLVPMQETNIRLVSERLRIDFSGGRVRAEYLVDNPDPDRGVKLGVPLLWQADSRGPGDDRFDDPLAPVKEGLRKIAITVGGRRHGCALELSKESRARPDAVFIAVVAGWCVATGVRGSPFHRDRRGPGPLSVVGHGRGLHRSLGPLGVLPA